MRFRGSFWEFPIVFQSFWAVSKCFVRFWGKQNWHTGDRPNIELRCQSVRTWNTKNHEKIVLSAMSTLPYARHYKPRLVYFSTPFPKTIYVLWPLGLCMACIQERVKSVWLSPQVCMEVCFWNKKVEIVLYPCQRPNHVERTRSRPITEVKQHWA